MEPQPTFRLEDPFQRSFLLQYNRGDIAIGEVWARPKNGDVAIKNASIDHAVPLNPQGEKIVSVKQRAWKWQNLLGVIQRKNG